MDTALLIAMMDGPLEGRVHIHEIEPGFPVPVRFAERDPTQPAHVPYYRVIGDDGSYQAFFDCSETIAPHNRPTVAGMTWRDDLARV